MAQFKNPYPGIADLHCFDFSKGSKVNQGEIDEWVKKTYNACLGKLNDKGYAMSRIRSGDGFVQCEITDFKNIEIFIVTSSGYKVLSYTDYGD